MNFSFQLKTRIFFGENCLFLNKSELKKLGKKAFIVTGKKSGELSGALDAVKKVLEDLNITYFIFDSINNNPSLDNIYDGAKASIAFSPNFIVGIGGGSPIDAAKAISVLTTNKIEPIELYNNDYPITPLPIIAIPTTAGSGSEVTPYAVLTRNDLQTKKSFGNEYTVPRIAFLDPIYVRSLPTEHMISSAIDAFSHAVEGYLTTRSTTISDIFALQSLMVFGECLHDIQDLNFNYNVTKKLFFMSLLSGILITQTGTTSVHNMGYSLTYFKNVAHGKATGLLLAEYLREVSPSVIDKIDTILSITGIKSIDSLKAILRDLLPYDFGITKDEFELYSSLAIKQKSIMFNPLTLNQDNLEKIFIRSFN